MRQSNMKDAAIYSELVSIIERDSDAVYDILEVLISNLNDSQFEQLIDMYIDTVVDSMSHEDLQYYVTNNMAEFMHELTFSGVLEEIKYTLDDEMLEEFITEIKNDSKD